MKTLKASFISIALFLLTSCHGGGFDRATTLFIGLGAPPTNLDPRYATDAASQRIDDLVFTALVRIGPQMEPVPEGAVSWKVDDRKITFELRQDLKFHNGRKVEASDVVYSFEEFRKAGSATNSILGSIAAVEAPTPSSVVLTLLRNDASLITNLNLVKFLPREEVEKWKTQFASHLVGSGPLEFVKANDTEVILKKFSSGTYAMPSYDNFVIKIVRDDNTRFLKMIKGEIDFLLNELPEEKVKDLQKNQNLKVLITEGLNFNYILINLKNPKFSSTEVRRALFSALNRDEIIRYKLENMAQLATTILSPVNSFALKNAQIKTLPIEKAKKVIKDAGLFGKEISLKTSAQASENGKIIAQQLETLGLKIKLQSFEWGTFYSDVKAGNFDLATMRWVGLVDPDLYRDTLASSEFPPGRNRGYYSNKTFDEIVQQARTETDPEKRRNLYTKAQQIVLDDLPILPLWYNSNITVHSLRVSGFTPIITGSYYPLLAVSIASK